MHDWYSLNQAIALSRFCAHVLCSGHSRQFRTGRAGRWLQGDAMNLRTESKFRAAAMFEAGGVADALRADAEERDAIAGAAHGYEPGTLRRKVRAIVLATVEAAVEAEGVL
jgi:hypothetical protein